ncbi:MAG: hypothetical protein HOQ44_09380 [Nocardia sp.]|nr:hypothetical protein [Nocardia sp.]
MATGPADRFRVRPAHQLPAPAGFECRTASALIVAGVVGVAVVVLVIGVAIGSVVGGRGEGSAPAPAPEPATYSVRAITDACDLVDLEPLTGWASAPLLDPAHEEDPGSGDVGSLLCNVHYTSSPGDEFPMNTAGMRVRAEVVDGSAAREYDRCKRTTADLADNGSAVTSGEFGGTGTRGYWQFEADDFGGIVDARYSVCVWDGSAAVQVQIDLSREKAAPAVRRDELDPVARSQARKVLDALRQNR